MNNIFSHLAGKASRVIKHWWLYLVCGILSVAAGIVLIFNPLESYVTLSVFFGVMVLVSGIFSMCVAVGSRNLFMANVHVAHDCRVGDDIIIANNVALAGHVHVEDHAIVGGQAGVHQFVRIGTYAMVGGASAVLRDVPPYVICHLNPCTPAGLNLVGLRRAGFSAEFMNAAKACYKALYREGNLVADAAREMEALIASFPKGEIRDRLQHFRDFVVGSPRGVIR